LYLSLPLLGLTRILRHNCLIPSTRTCTCTLTRIRSGPLGCLLHLQLEILVLGCHLHALSGDDGIGGQIVRSLFEVDLSWLGPADLVLDIGVHLGQLGHGVLDHRDYHVHFLAHHVLRFVALLF